jgi:hypothetical protein
MPWAGSIHLICFGQKRAFRNQSGIVLFTFEAMQASSVTKIQQSVVIIPINEPCLLFGV